VSVCVCMYVSATEGPSHSLCIWQGCSGSFELHKSSRFFIHLGELPLRSLDTEQTCFAGCEMPEIYACV